MKVNFQEIADAVFRYKVLLSKVFGVFMYTELRRYKEKEFCKDVNCQQLHRNTVNPDHFYCKRRSGGCTKTAKEFHDWINNEGFNLLKPTDRYGSFHRPALGKPANLVRGWNLK